MLQQIVKRDGSIVEFQQDKITNAIAAAGKATGEFDSKIAQKISDLVLTNLEKKFKKTVPTVEETQDLVEQILIEQKYVKTAKAYIIYRKQREKIRKTESVFLDITKTIDDYLQRADWRVNENSNMGYSLGGAILHAAGAVIANYVLSNVYPDEVAGAHINGDIHIHDLGMGITGYCAGWNLQQLLLEGFNGVHGKVASGPAKHFSTALGQMVNFLGTLQNEWAGAQAFSSFDTYLAPFVHMDKLTYEEVKQGVQSFVFNLNVSSRWGGQTPFTNITLDWTVPEHIKSEPAVWGGKVLDKTYGDFQKEMDMINKAFIEVMLEGDSQGRVFTFPIPTHNITKDFEWNSENSELLFEMAAKYGVPYFQNFVNSDIKPSDVRSMCCRLQLDLRELRKKTGGLFGAGESTGSIGVVTINLPRIGYLAKTKEEFFERLENLMEISKTSLELKRDMVNRHLHLGLLPYTSRYLGNLNHHFSTIGINGMNEALLNFLHHDIASKEGRAFALEVLNFMRDTLQRFQEETGNLYNLEATPAEGTTRRFAAADKKKYPDIIVANEKQWRERKASPYYTNSTHLPVQYTDDVFEALDHQDEMQTKYTSGTVLHIFMGERMTSGEACKKLVRKICDNYRLPYFTITPSFSVCPKHGYLVGSHEFCPKCDAENGYTNSITEKQVA